MPRTRDTLPFEYVGGSAALDFVNTVSWRGEEIVRNERLHSFDSIVAWAVEGGLVTAKEAAQLRRAATAAPSAARREFVLALRFRAALHALFASLAEGREPESLGTVNRMLRATLRSVELQPAGGALAWRTEGGQSGLQIVRHRVALDAVQLLTRASDVVRLRCCAMEICGWLFVDRSRRGNRRWCKMYECGSRDKSRRYYRRNKARRSGRRPDQPQIRR